MKNGTQKEPDASDNRPKETSDVSTVSNKIDSALLEIKSRTPRRVKVYLLQGEDWLDNGTGYCVGQVDSETKKPFFIVRNELDSDDVILKSYLEGYIQYQRQQETLIVWTDLSGKDLALSFQENEGCADLCEFIVRVQQENLSPMISLYYVLSALQEPNVEGPREITELITGPVSYPADDPCKESLESVLDVVNQGSNSQYTRSKILTFIIENNYLPKLFDVFHRAEQEKDLPSLLLLSDIIKILFVYNDIALLAELLRSEENVMGFVGILEYDRDYPKFKACHRDFLQDETKFKSVIDLPKPPISPGTSMEIFRRDFILNYLKNVVLASKLDDQTLSSLSSMLYNNQVYIIDFLKNSQSNNNFLERLFSLYDLKNHSVKQQRDGVKMLHQYALVAKSQLNSLRPEFFTALVRAGLFKMIKFALSDSDSDIRVVGTQLLTTVMDQDVSLVNSAYGDESQVDEVGLMDDHIPGSKDDQDAEKVDDSSEPFKLNLVNDMSLTLVLGQLLLNDKNPGLKIQAYEAIRTMLCAAISDGEGELENDHEQSKAPDNNGSTRKYLASFYDRVAPTIFKDFIDLGGDDAELAKVAEEKMMCEPILYQHLCDLISFCCREHEPTICRPFFFENNVLKGILKILNLKVKVTLKLGAMRCFKSLILLNDYLICRYIIDNNLFEPYFDFFESVAEENSLANSLCLDLLEIIIRRSLGKNFRTLAIHIYDNYKLFLETHVNYVSTGRDLVQTVESHVELTKDPTATSVDGEQDDIPHHDNPSSPIRSDDTDEHERRPLSEPHNMFENIEKEVNSKRLREDEHAEKPSEEPNGDNSQRKKASLQLSDSPAKDGPVGSQGVATN